MIYAFGSNGSGQLGIGHRNDVDKPTPCLVPALAEFEHHKPVKVSSGGNHILILMDSGIVYSAGDNANGRCCRDTISGQDRCCLAPICATPKGRTPIFQHCSATWEATVLIDSSGAVLTGGTGRRGELGLGMSTVDAMHLTQIPEFPPAGTEVVDIASSMAHTVVVLSNGHAYGWGAGRQGQIGQPASDCWTPRKIEGIPFEAHRAVCGKEFTVIAGSPDVGGFTILGSQKWTIKSSAPESIRGWIDLGASWNGMYVLLKGGRLLCWGRNDLGQLPPIALEDLDAIAVGSEHCLAKRRDGKLIAWGWGEHGNCGPMRSDAQSTLRELDTSSIAGTVDCLGAGCATSWIYANLVRPGGPS